MNCWGPFWQPWESTAQSNSISVNSMPYHVFPAILEAHLDGLVRNLVNRQVHNIRCYSGADLLEEQGNNGIIRNSKQATDLLSFHFPTATTGEEVTTLIAPKHTCWHVEGRPNSKARQMTWIPKGSLNTAAMCFKIAAKQDAWVLASLYTDNLLWKVDLTLGGMFV